MSDWQPADTAPRTGEAILATNRGYAYNIGRCVIVYWDDDDKEWLTPEREAYRWMTHWMPLPAAPE